MSSNPRGKALIINNKIFEKLSRRRGTDNDRDELKKNFESLGFHVDIKNNKTGKEIEASIELLSKDDHTKFDCVVLAILSHGDEGVVYGKDSGEVEIHKMIAMFDADKCEKLRGKPKLFFIQACRGDKKDAGVEVSDGIGPAGDEWTEKDLIDRQMEDQKEAHRLLYPAEVHVDSTDCMGSVRSKIPTHSDVFLGYSTIPGYVSWRNKDSGSWYIQALTEVFKRNAKKEDAKKEDLVSMMTTVNDRVASEASSQDKCKQTPVFASGLRKKLFFPGQ